MVEKPVRRVVTRSGRGIRGKFPSLKMGGMIEWESPLEADAIRLFEFNAGIVSYGAQPSHEIYHDASGNARRFVPDFRVQFRHGSTLLVEVKSDADAVYPPTARVLGLKAMAMQAQGKHYRVLTPAEIRKQPRFANLKLLERSAKAPLAPEIHEILRALDRRSVFRVEDLGQAIGGVFQVFRALSHGSLLTDLGRSLDTEGLVWHPDHPEAGDGSFPI